jgi:RecA-family ATPase
MTRKKKTGAIVYAPQMPTLPDDGNSPCDIIAAGGEQFFKSIIGMAKPWSSTGPQTSTLNTRPVVLLAEDVKDKPLEYLLDHRIPIRMLTGLVGDPGSGKTWVGLKIAADGSRGKDTFSGKKIKPFNTLYWTSESLPETIKRRFVAMGGDPKRLYILTGAVNAEGKPVSLTLENVAELEQAVKTSTAKLVIVDPLQSFIGAKVDMHRANETRPLLDGLSNIADSMKLAAIVVRHLSKTGGSHAVTRGLGSVDIVAKVRTEYVVGTAPDGSGIQAFAHLKYGELQRQESIKFEIEGKDANAHLVWKGHTTLTAAELLAPEKPAGTPKPREVASAFLVKALKDGPRDPKELEEECGVPYATLLRAAQALRVVMTGDKKKGDRLWKMAELKSDTNRRKAKETTEDDE